MKKTASKVTALILSAVVAACAGAAFAATASAAPIYPDKVTVEVTATTEADFVNRPLNFVQIVDQDGNPVNPYTLFGTSFRLAHSMILNDDGTFSVALGCGKENAISGTFVYNELSQRFFLNYNDGFNAIAYVAIKADGTKVISAPIMIFGEIFIVEFKL